MHTGRQRAASCRRSCQLLTKMSASQWSRTLDEEQFDTSLVPSTWICAPLDRRSINEHALYPCSRSARRSAPASFFVSVWDLDWLVGQRQHLPHDVILWPSRAVNAATMRAQAASGRLARLTPTAHFWRCRRAGVARKKAQRRLELHAAKVAAWLGSKPHLALQ
jgi:hypothetical protein